MKNRFHSRAFLLSPAVTALTFVLAMSSAQAKDFYKANNTTDLRLSGSWVEMNGDPTNPTYTPANVTNSSDSWIWDNRVVAPGTITQGANVGIKTITIVDPGGPVTLNGGSSSTVLSVSNGGGIDMSQATQDLTFTNYATGSNVGYRLGGSNVALTFDVPVGRLLTMDAKVAVQGGSGGAGITFNGVGTTIFTQEYQPTKVTVNAGVVQFNRASGSNRIGTPITIVNGGRLMVNNSSGSATDDGTVMVNNSGTLGGQGIIASAVTAASGSTLAPGNNAIGSLSLGALNLQAGAKLDWEITDTLVTDSITVTNSNGLNIEGGTFNLYDPGTTTPFSGIGDFPLFNYTGAISGAGIASLSVSPATMVPGHNYVFAIASGVVTLRITSGPVTQTYWNVNASSAWSLGTNWTGGVSPDATGTHAAFGGGGTPITEQRTVTVDGARTTSSLLFNSVQPFTLAGSGPLTLNDSGFAATVDVLNGNHVISSPIALTTGGAVLSLDPATSLTISSVINGTGLGIFKSGDGLLVLTGNNSYTGTTSIGSGVLQIGTGGTTGQVQGSIANSGTLRFNRSDNHTPDNPISGPGNLDQAGSGQLELAYDTTFTGDTTISNGSLFINSPTCLQGSTLNLSMPGGSFKIGVPAYPLTLGGLSGTQNFPMRDQGFYPIGIVVGANNKSTTYSGSGMAVDDGDPNTEDNVGDTFTKVGTGTLTLSGTLKFEFGTTVSGGVLKFDPGANFTTNIITFASTGGGKLLINGGSFLSSNMIPTLVPNGSAGIEVSGGTATFNGGITTETNSAAGGSRVASTGGILNTPSLSMSRGNLNIGPAEPTTGQTANGLYLNGGIVNITGIEENPGNVSIGGIAQANSSVSARMDGGTLNVSGSFTIGINNLAVPSTNAARWSIFDINGGTFNGGVGGIFIGSPYAGQVTMQIRNATAIAKAERIQFGQNELAGQYFLNLSAGALYVGSGGLVVGSSDPGFTAAARLSGGTLGASADSVSSVPVSLTGPAVITAADETNAPHSMTLGGAISGTGSLTKSGSGTLVLSGTNTSSGDTTVTGGILAVSGSSIDNGAALIINGGQVQPLANESVGSLILGNGGVPVANGSYGSLSSNADNKSDLYFTTGSTGMIIVGGTPAGSYASWAAINAPGQTPGEDYNNNGLDNGIEYFMGLSLSSQLPNIGPADGTVTWPKDPNYQGTFMIQTSDTMEAGDWDDVPVNAPNPIDIGTSVEYTPPTGLGKVFIRLRVTPN